MIFEVLIYILSTFITLYTIYLGIILIVGFFTKNKEYPKADFKDIAILIPCNNEEKVISRLLDSLDKQTYDKDKYDIFVIAHNCLDNTANIAKKMKANVLELNDPNASCKTDALNFALKYLKNNSKREYDYIVVFDADCICDFDFLEKINNAMATGCDVASGFFRSINYNTNIISKLCSMLYLMTMTSNSIPLNCFKLPVNFYGTGVCLKYDLIKDGWQTTTLVEDFELVVKEVLNGKKFIFASEASFKAEMPIDLISALKQRRRWAIGDTQCFKKYIGIYLKNFNNLKASGFKQLIDLCLNPFLLLGSIGIFLCIIELVFTNKKLFILNFLLIELVCFCLVYFLSAIMTMKKENIPIIKNINVIILMPVWFSVSIVYAIESFFVKNVNFDKTTHLGVVDESNI